MKCATSSARGQGRCWRWPSSSSLREPGTRTLFSDLESTALRTASGVHWEEETPGWQNMTTPLSTSAMVVYALAQRDPGTR